jgi:hypothetical protein
LLILGSGGSHGLAVDILFILAFGSSSPRSNDFQGDTVVEVGSKDRQDGKWQKPSQE